MMKLIAQRVAILPDNKSPLKGYILAIVAAVGWSMGGLLSNWMMTKAGPDTAQWIFQPMGIEIEPSVLSGARAFSASIILGIILLIFSRADFKLEKRPLKSIAFLAPLGVSLASMHFTYFAAIRSSNVPTAILLEYMAPVLTLAFAVIVLKTKVDWRSPFAVVLAILGCAIVVGAFDPGGLKVSTEGLLWGIAAAVTFALYSQLGSMGSDRFSAAALLFYGLVFAALMWFVALGPNAIIQVFQNPVSAIAVVLMAIFSTISPFGAYLMSLRYISATHAAVTAMLEPVVAAFGSWLLYGTELSLSLLLGGGIIIGAIILIQLSTKVPQGEFPIDEEE